MLLRVPLYILSAAGRFDMSESSHVWMSHVTHMNASCHIHEWDMLYIWMSHVTFSRTLLLRVPFYILSAAGRSEISESSHIWMSHVTQMNESCHTWMSHVTFYHLMPLRVHFHILSAQVDLIWVSLVKRVNESRHNTSMSHVTHTNESCHTYEWGMPWRMRHVTFYHTIPLRVPFNCLLAADKFDFVYVMPHIWMSHVTTHQWVMAHIWMSHVTSTNGESKHMNESHHFLSHDAASCALLYSVGGR